MRKPYPTDLSDAEWTRLQAYLPNLKAEGRPRTHPLRDVLDAIPPATLRSLVRESVERHMDPGRLRVLKLAEEQERALLRGVWGGAA